MRTITFIDELASSLALQNGLEARAYQVNGRKQEVGMHNTYLDSSKESSWPGVQELKRAEVCKNGGNVGCDTL